MQNYLMERKNISWNNFFNEKKSKNILEKKQKNNFPKHNNY